MDILKLADNIKRLRQEQNITQEQLAQFLNVTKASVSKWENGQTFPDVMMLPKLATYFDVTIDELLGYEPILSDEECRRIYGELCDDFADCDFNQALEKSRELVRKYYSCYQLLENIVIVWMNHYMFAPPEIGAEILEEALQLCERILKNSDDMRQCNDIIMLKATVQLLLGKYEEVIGELEVINDPLRYSIQGESVLVSAYEMAQDMVKADEYIQISMYIHILSIIDMACHDITVHGTDLTRCQETYSRIVEIAEQYNIKELNYNAMCQADIRMAMTYAAHGRQMEAIDLLKKIFDSFIQLIDNGSIELHGDEYFYSLSKWIDRLKLKGTIPRDMKYVKMSMLSIFDNPVFAGLQGQEEYVRLKESAYKKLEITKED